MLISYESAAWSSRMIYGWTQNNGIEAHNYTLHCALTHMNSTLMHNEQNSLGALSHHCLNFPHENTCTALKQSLV